MADARAEAGTHAKQSMSWINQSLRVFLAVIHQHHLHTSLGLQYCFHLGVTQFCRITLCDKLSLLAQHMHRLVRPMLQQDTEQHALLIHTS